MKQKFLLFSAGIMLCLLATVNFAMNTQFDRVSNLTLVTVEATASEEGGGEEESSFSYRWQQISCFGDQAKWYEQCTDQGNGYMCLIPGSKTREC